MVVLSVLSLWLSLALASAAEEASPPFAQFYGTWTLKDDTFQQVWDTKTLQTLTIPNHITVCDKVNTDQTVLCVVDAGGLKGHILWAYDKSAGLRHLSHFGTSRLGTGAGTIDDAGNLRLRVQFTDEPEGTYRLYTYEWRDPDTYEMVSRQYDADDRPTGNWYGGTFVRLAP
ncbi:MAG: hypothetical protein AAGH41_12830 [Pseudomonadota bacterium]